MIEVSDELRALLNSGSAPAPKIKIKTDNHIFGYDDETDSNNPIEQNNILSLSIYYAGASDDYPLGSANSNYIDVELWDVDSEIVFHGKETTVFVGYEVNGSVEWINAGVFFPEKPAHSGQITSFAAYDRMKTLTGLYIPNLDENSEHTILAYLADIANQFGFSFKLASFPLLQTTLSASLFTSADTDNETGQIISIGYSAQKCISYLAGAAGCNAMFNRNDELQFYQFSEVLLNEGAQYEITDNNTNNPSIAESNHAIEYISCNNSKKEICSISDTQNKSGVYIENPFITTQARLNSIYSVLSLSGEPFSYRTASLEHLSGDITLECFDVIKYTEMNGNSYQLPIMKLDYTYDGGLMCNIASLGKTESEVQNEPSALNTLNSKLSSTAQAISNINSTLSEFRTSYTEMIQSSQSIMLKAIEEYAKTEDLELLKATISAQLEVTAAGINMSFTELQEKVSAETAQANEQLNTINSYIRLENGTAIFGKEGSIYDLTIDNEALSINRNSEAKAYMNSDGFYSDDIWAGKKSGTGDFALIQRSSGNLCLKKVR